MRKGTKGASTVSTKNINQGAISNAVIGGGCMPSKLAIYRPVEEAIGSIKNWPIRIQDEEVRLKEFDFVSIEEMPSIAVGISGAPVLDIDGIIGRSSNLAETAIHTLLFVEVENDDETEEVAIASQIESIDSGEDILDTPEKIAEYYGGMYPWLFKNDVEAITMDQSRVSFHGATRRSITPKTKLRAKPNSKKGKFPDFRSSQKRHRTIRTAHLDHAVIQAERQRFYQDVFQMERQSSNFVEA
jgi:hypothetical protein